MPMCARGSWLSFLGFMVVPFLHAQAPPATTTSGTTSFTLNARAVVVDVVVTDPAGQPVTGLKQKEFKLLENGKEQELNFFEEHVPGNTAMLTAPIALSGFWSNAPAGLGPDPVAVLLIDELNTTREYRERMFTAAREFLGSLPSGTQAEILLLKSKLELVQGFTADVERLETALDQSKAKAGSELNAGTRTAGDDADDRMTGAVFAANGATYNGGEAIKQVTANHATDVTLRALEELGKNLAGAPGRKSLFWFAGTFPVSLFPEGDHGAPRQQNQYGRLLRESADQLGQAKVAVYPVSVVGVTNSPSSEAAVRSEEQHGGDVAAADQEQTAAQLADVAGAEALASETGGKALYGANDFGKQAAQALRTGEHYYTLIYTPTEVKADGKFRRIEVKTSGGNYRLAYRRGYYADAAANEVGQEATDPLPAMLAASGPPATQVVYQLRSAPASPQPLPGAAPAGGNAKLPGPTTRLRVDFKVPLDSVAMDPAGDGGHTGKIELGLIAYDSKGTRLNWAASVSTVTLDASAEKTAQEAGLGLHLDLDVPAGASRLSTGVYDRNSGRAGTLEIPVNFSPAASEAETRFAKAETQPADAEPASASAPPTASIPEADPSRNEAAANLPKGPVLLHRPPPAPPTQKIREGQIRLDASVSNAEGKPVTGLQPCDFNLLDNDQSRKILSFRAFNDAEVPPDPPVEIILLIDELNLLPPQVAFVRDELEQYLRRNNGRLDHPVSLMLLSDAGLRVQPRPAQDGNALIKVVKGIGAHISSINPAMGGEGELERFQISLRQMETIAENEVSRPGRKLLIWMGPGWPMLERANHSFTPRDQQLYFDAIVELTTRLREARIVVNSIAPAETNTTGAEAHRFAFKDYVKGVQTAKQAESGNLALKVFVTQTGGLILGPTNDMVGQIDQCVANSDAFYRISFNPPPAQHANEYHDLKVEVKQGGMTVKTNSGYYNQPANP
jgi:VWFA-related protein